MLRALLLASFLFAAFASSARADVQWLCEPGLASDPCRGDLTTRVFEADGSSKVVPGAPAAAPKVDCFYVYPTTSNQPTTNATKAADPEIRSIAKYQAQRFSSRCRVFAPLYRQVTAAGVTTASQTRDASPYTLAFEDVREAFLEYLAQDNQGRGFVLVGHSQGSRILRALIRAEIDGKADVRRRMVSAIIPGANAQVEDFKQVPPCESGPQTGCVMSWHTFNETPPANARFGRTDTDPVGSALDLPRGGSVICTDPAVLAGRAGQPLQTLVPSEPFAPGIIAALLVRFYGGPPPSSPDTPWLTPADRYTSRCETVNGARVLAIAPVGAARRLTPSPDPSWGVHLVDVNLPLGDLMTVVDAQVAAFTRRAPRALSATLAARRTSGRVRQLAVTVRGTPESELRVILLRGDKFLTRRSLTLDDAGRGVQRFRIRRAGPYRVVVRDADGRTFRSRTRRLSLR